MTRKFGYYYKGAVKLSVRGEYPERFINLCIADHIYLWGVKKRGDCMTVWIAPADFFRIRPIVRKSRMRVRVERRYGFPFFFKRLKRRRMLLVGAALFLAAIYWLSSYIWFVDIIGTKSVSPDKIKVILEAHGLRAGARQSEIAVKKLEKDLMIELPEVAWAGVRFTGTRAVVEVVEKVLPIAEDKSPGDLVADKSGTVTECIPLTGESVVKAGDQVKEGDVLIRGAGAQAQGIVKANIVYESYGEAELTQNQYALTGNALYSVTLRLGGENFALYQADTSGFTAYEHDRIVKKLPWWRNQDFTVESIIDVYRELSVNLSEIDVEEAKRLATLAALEESRALIQEDAYVAERSIDVLDTGDPNLVRVRLRIETEEEIGKHIQYIEE